MKMLYIQQRNL